MAGKSNKEMTSVERYGHPRGRSPDEVKKAALTVVARSNARGAQLVFVFTTSPVGMLFLTLALSVGKEIMLNPALTELSWGMGAMAALRFLSAYIHWRLAERDKCATGVAYNAEQAALWENDPGANRGVWVED